MTTTPVDTPVGTKTAINPRIRERRIEVRREAGRRRLRVLLVVSSVLSAVGLAFLAVTSPVLDVDHIRIVGAQHVTLAQVRAASSVHVHDHLLFVDAGAAAHRIEQLPWVEHATVARDFPGTLKIRITEYTPSAYVKVANGVMLVAANGHVIAHATRDSREQHRGARRARTTGARRSVVAPRRGRHRRAPSRRARAVGRGRRHRRERRCARPHRRRRDPSR